MTNVLVEGGSRLLNTLFDMYAIDEVHVFTAPKDAGGDSTSAPRLSDSSRSRTSSPPISTATSTSQRARRVRSRAHTKSIVRPTRRVFVERKRRARGEGLHAEFAVEHGVRETELAVLLRVVAAERHGRHERGEPIAASSSRGSPPAARAGGSAGRFRGRD